MRIIYPGRLDLRGYCQALLQRMRRTGNFHMVELFFGNLMIREPEPHVDT